MIYHKDNRSTIYLGDCIEEMKNLEDNSVDSIVTDPPYNLSFMGKGWDNKGSSHNFQKWCQEWAVECLRVLKPGGYLLSFGGTRQFHRMASGIEDAGFEIRDTIFWMYGSGFPKSQNISKNIDKKLGEKREKIKVKPRPESSGTMAGSTDSRPWIEKSREVGYHEVDDNNPVSDLAKKWNGWGTNLKPAFEPIIMARKPISEKTIVDNVLKYGTGAINIDACRIDLDGDYKSKANGRPSQTGLDDNYNPDEANQPDDLGRWPANIIWDGSDEVQEEFDKYGIKKSGKMGPWNKRTTDQSPNGIYGKFDINHKLSKTPGDSGSISRFFYCPKASKKDRDEGLEDLEFGNQANLGISKLCSKCKITQRHAYEPENLGKCDHEWVDPERKNTHPTVKPTSVMQWLIKLVTPTEGIVLDIFSGAGSTGKACMKEGFRFIGIDMEEEYCRIAKARIEKENSMIYETNGDCLKFSQRDPEKIAVVIHCCNDIGAWGSGFVLALNDRFGDGPKNAYLNGKMNLGDLSYFHSKEDNCIVFNIIGQEGVVSPDNLRPINYDAIYKGCEKVFTVCQKAFGEGKWEIHMPKMGSGLAQGNWTIIRTIINETIAKNGINTYIYSYEQNKENND